MRDKSVLQKWIKVALNALCIILGLSVVTIGGLRLAFHYLPLAESYIATTLSSKLGAELRIGKIETTWAYGEPTLYIQDATLSTKDKQQPAFTLDRLDVALDLRQSILQRTLIFKHFVLGGVTVYLDQSEDTMWHLRGLPFQHFAASTTPKSSVIASQRAWLKWLGRQNQLFIRNVSLQMQRYNGEQNSVIGREVSLTTVAAEKVLAAKIQVDNDILTASAKGIYNRGRFYDWTGHVTTSALDLENLCGLTNSCKDNIQNAIISTDLQWRLHDDHWRLSGPFALQELKYTDNQQQARTLSASTNILLHGAAKNFWQLWINELAINSQAQQWQSNWYLQGDYQDNYAITLATDELDVAAVTALVLDSKLLPEQAETLTQTLNPAGALQQVAVRTEPFRGVFDFDLTAQLQSVSVDAWGGAPLAKHINGSLRMGLKQGVLALDAPNFTLGFPKLFREDWVYEQASGNLQWQLFDDTFKLAANNLALDNKESGLRGKLHLDIPLNQDPLMMGLTVGINGASAAAVYQYIPTGLPMDKSLSTWLDSAIKQAAITHGGFLWNGTLKNTGNPYESRWGLYLDIDNGKIQYAPDWPTITELSGEVVVNNDNVFVNAAHANTLGGALNNTEVSANIGGDDPVTIKVDSRLKGQGSTLRKLLTETPIRQQINKVADDFHFKGMIDAPFNIDIPLDNIDQLKVSTTTALNRMTFSIPKTGIAVTDISGILSFDTTHGLNAKKLSAKLFGKPASFSIHSQGMKSTQIQWQSQLSPLALAEWLQQSWLTELKGMAPYNATLTIADQTEGLQLALYSSLQGMSLALPAPFTKQKNEAWPLQLTYQQQKRGGLLDVAVQGKGRFYGKLNEDNDITTAVTSFGKTTPISRNRLIPQTITVTGQLSELNVMAWKDRLQHCLADIDQPAISSPKYTTPDLRIDNLRVHKLIYGDNKALLNSRINISQNRQKDTLIAVNSDTLEGSLLVTDKPTTPWRLIVKQAKLPNLLTSNSDKPSKKPALLQQITPDSLPDIDVDIQSLQIGERTPISTKFSIRKENNGVTIDHINTTLADLLLSGFADWVKTGKDQRSWLNVKLSGSDIAKLQTYLDLPILVSAKKGLVDAQINWIGAPNDVNVRTMKGRVNIAFEKGTLHKLDKKASRSLKAFSIFNTAALARRMQLDFSDIFKSGVPFDKIKGQLNINKGLVTFENPLVIEGSTSNFKLDGVIDANRQRLDLSLVVTLPMSSNLPILSVLLGTAAPVAGAIFLADQLVGDQVNQLASIRYRIHGSFDNPQMTLDKLFSNTPKKPSSQSISAIL